MNHTNVAKPLFMQINRRFFQIKHLKETGLPDWEYFYYKSEVFWERSSRLVIRKIHLIGVFEKIS